MTVQMNENLFLNITNTIDKWNEIKDPSEALIAKMDYILPLAIKALAELNEPSQTFEQHLYSSINSETKIDESLVIDSVYKESLINQLKNFYHSFNDSQKDKVENFIKDYALIPVETKKINLIKAIDELEFNEEINVYDWIQNGSNEVKNFLDNFKEETLKLIENLKSQMEANLNKINVLNSLKEKEIIYAQDLHLGFGKLAYKQTMGYAIEHRFEPPKNKWSHAHDQIDLEYYQKKVVFKQKIYHNDIHLPFELSSEAIIKGQQENRAYRLEIETLKAERKFKHAEIKEQRNAEVEANKQTQAAVSLPNKEASEQGYISNTDQAVLLNFLIEGLESSKIRKRKSKQPVCIIS